MENQAASSAVEPGPLRGAVLAVLFVAAAFALTVVLQHVALRAYFILFVPAVMFATWFGGRAAGMFASGLTVAAALYLLPRAEVVDQLAWLIVAGVVAVATSVLTDARRRAEALLSVRAEEESSRRRDAESLSQLKTELLAQVAHELRQPLSAMSTAAALIDSAASEGARQRAAAVVRRQINHLGLLVDDLLDLSRLTRRELKLHKSEIDLCEIVSDSVNVVAADIVARRLDLLASVPPCPVYVTADPTRVRQILSNLLSNAVKFTPDGGTIQLELEQAASHVVIRVRDNGQGISPDRLPVIFDLFQKGDDGSTGLGVGLAVVKGLAEMHGGSVEVSSGGIGQGSEFAVTLPIARDPSLT